jgi:hypothetical protein
MGFLGKTNSSATGKTTPFSMADSLPVQTKLSVSKASDPAEKEADTVARKVVDEQKDQKAAKQQEKKEPEKAPPAMTEPAPDTKKEGVKTKGEEKKEAKKKEDSKEEKKAAKKGEDKKEAQKKDDDKKDVQKKEGDKEEKKAAKKGDEKKDVQKKGSEKKEVKKKDGDKEEKKAAKKGDEKKEVQKKGSEKKEVKKKDGDKEEKKAAKKEENNKEKKPVDQEKDKSASPKGIQRKESPGTKNSHHIQQKPAFASRSVQKQDAGKATGEPESDDEAKLQAVEQKINAKKGGGRPLNQQVKADMESSFGHDFSEVRIHNDKEAAELCASLNAQAFAIGNDIFFNEGRYDAESDKGKELLAHELTHVVQQTGHIQKSVVMRNPTATPGAAAPEVKGKFDGTKITIDSPALSLPKTKETAHRAAKYPKTIRTKAPYDRDDATAGTDAQTKIWEDGVTTEVEAHVDKLIAKVKGKNKPQNDKQPEFYYFEHGDIKLFGNKETIVQNSKRPLWNRNGKVTGYDVDHILELQLEGGENVDTNLELLNFSANRGSGAAISGAIKQLVGQFLKTNDAGTLKDKDVKGVMAKHVVEFKDRKFDKVTGTTPKGGDFWQLSEIKKGDHLTAFSPMTKTEVEKMTGTDAKPSAFTSPAGGGQITEGERMPGFNAKIKINKADTSGATANEEVGSINVKLFEDNSRIIKPMDANISLYGIPGMGKGGYIARRDPGKKSLESVLRRLDFLGLSPVIIESADIIPGKGLMVKGKIQPSVEMVKDLYIDFTIEGNKVELSRTFSSGELKSIPPPLKVNDCSITVFAGTGGIGVRGLIDFEINKVGKGQIKGSGNSDGLFRLDGNFDFDEKLFGGVKANVKASYEHQSGGGEDKWDVKGNIKIPKGKIKGIESAEINVNYENRIFKADGSAKFDIPGLEDGKMSVTYGNDQLIIEGEANFKHKFIKSGQVKAKVENKGDVTSVSMSGNAKPNIPGVDTDLSVDYKDGVFTVSGTVGYAKGRLTGSVTVGVTNQAVGADGKPSGGAGEDLTVFGSGSLTLKITDFLQGTAGVTFKPDGSVEVVGKIGIPQAVNIFEKKEITKQIFKAPTLEIPIFAIPLGPRSIGLVATIGGGLDAFASIGPGQLTDASVEVKYNPQQEESMSVTGTAKFRVPAEAGLRLSVKAGIGLSIGIARVSGGIELAGSLGIEGAAEAGVTVNWTPTTGFKLDAEASISVQPKFKFEVNAFIEATLDLWITEISETWRWNLASFEYGSAMKFGIKFPVHYEENKPFDISLNDVQFEAPDISVGDFAKGIGKQLLG